MPHKEKIQGGKLNSHDAKVEDRSVEHQANELAKQDVRMERHSGTGRGVREPPKKCGAGGKGTWGSVDDEIKDALAGAF